MNKTTEDKYGTLTDQVVETFQTLALYKSLNYESELFWHSFGARHSV